MDIHATDSTHVWHPYAPMHDPLGARPVVGATGVRLQLTDGSELIDGMSSWWAAIHGYRHPALDQAVREQLDAMAHVMFGGLTHEPAVRLCERLAQMTGLDHVFLADSGSIAVEVALKMAQQYQRGVGNPERTRFVALRGGYHGDTLGAMSVCDPVGGMHAMFADTLPQNYFLPRPPAGLDADIDAWTGECLAVLDGLDDVAGLILEPVLQGAGGMHIYPPAAVRWLADVAHERGWLLILDEIATGFRRLGHATFAFELADVTPDILCAGKALSAGYITLAATLTTALVTAGIEASESGVLMHGPTYMGNPLACAVANASLDLLDQYDVVAFESMLVAGLEPARDLPHVVDVRAIGAVGVIQLDRPVDVATATQTAVDHGVWIRPFRDLIYAMPPYIATPEEIATICAAMVEAARAQ